MQLYDRGIRRRLAPMLGNRPQLELANSLALSLPGTPVLRYGDEIGMGDDLDLSERNSVRTPMQWSNEINGGFSTAKKTVRPVIEKGSYGFSRVNVEAQRREPDSFLTWTAAMIRLRKECPEIGMGAWKMVETKSKSILALQYEWRGSSVVIMHNFASSPQTVHIRPEGGREHGLVDLIERQESAADGRGEHEVALDAPGYRWFRVGPLTQKLGRKRA